MSAVGASLSSLIKGKAVPASATKATSPAAWFCCTFLLVTLTLLAVPLAIARSELYPRLSGYPLDPIIDYPFSFKNASFDIVLFGDSAGLYGVDPRLIAAETGFSTVNLCRTGGILHATGDQALDFYLANNRRPKAIVLYLSPTAFKAGHSTNRMGSYEGSLTIWRHGSPQDAWRLVSSDLNGALDFWTQVVRFLTVRNDLRYRRAAGRFEEIENSFGHMTNPTEEPLSTGCSVDTLADSRIDDSFVQEFLHKYERQQIRVITFIAPTADCDRAFAAYRARLQPIADNRLFTLPHQLMAEDSTYMHPLPPAVPQLSSAVAQVVKDRMAQGSAMPTLVSARRPSSGQGQTKQFR